MNPTTITLGFGLLLAVILVFALRRQGGQLIGTGDLHARMQRVDMPAFLNLVDPAEERYLRSRLSGAEFRKLQRDRIGAMWEYLSRMSANAKLMMEAGQIVQHSGDPSMLVEANRLVADATRLRMFVFAADAYLVIRFLLPETTDPIQELVRRYDSARGLFDLTWSQHTAARAHSAAS